MIKILIASLTIKSESYSISEINKRKESPFDDSNKHINFYSFIYFPIFIKIMKYLKSSQQL